MNKKTRNIIIVSAVLLVSLVIIIFSVSYPPFSSGDAAGTVTKVSKFRKVQMSDSDILLRSEFLSDTTALSVTIRGLTVYNAFASDLAKEIEGCIIQLKENNIQDYDLNELAEYSAFIRNNNKTVENTIGVLIEFYRGDTTDFSVDVEGKLKEFDNFVHLMLEKNSAVDRAIPAIKRFVNTIDTKDRTRKAVVEKLRTVHDRMLLKNLVYAMFMGDREKINAIAANNSFLSSSGLGPILNKERLGLFSRENLMAIASNGNLNSILLDKEKLGPILSRERLNIAAREKLGIENKEQLKTAAREKLGSAGGKTGSSALISANTLAGKLGPIYVANMSSTLGFIHSRQTEALGLGNYKDLNYNTQRLNFIGLMDKVNTLGPF